MIKKLFILNLYCFLFLFCTFAKAQEANSSELEHDIERVDYLLKNGYSENECRELTRYLAKYKGKEANLKINLNDVFITVTKNYYSNKYLLDLIKQLANESNINLKDSNGYTALMYAVTAEDKVSIANYLIQRGADVNLVASAKKPPFPYLEIKNGFMNWKKYDCGRGNNYNYNFNYTPLLLAAAFNKNPEMIDMLIKNGADVNATDCFSRNALELAIYYNWNNAIAKKLIDLGFYKNRKSEYSEPFIILAILKNDYELVKTLIQHKTFLGQRTSDGKSIIYIIARYCNNLKIAEAIFEAGVTVYEKDDLYTAIEKNFNPDVVALLLKEAKKSMFHNLSQEDWSKLLFFAIRENSNYEKIIKKLLEYGASVHYENAYGDNAFLYAVKHYRNNKIFHLLEKRGTDVYACDKNENNAFLLAVEHRNFKRAEALAVVYKYDVNAINNSGHNALFICFDYPSTPSEKQKGIELLLKLGCNINFANEDGDTLLIKAASHNDHSDIVKLLIDKKADLEKKNKYGETALLCAAKYSICDNLIYLLKAGADVSVVDKYGYTVLGKIISSEKDYWYYFVRRKREMLHWNLLYQLIRFFNHEFEPEPDYNYEEE